MESANQQSEQVRLDIRNFMSEILKIPRCSKEQGERAIELHSQFIKWFTSDPKDSDLSVTYTTFSMLTEIKDRGGISPEAFILLANRTASTVKSYLEKKNVYPMEESDVDLMDFLDAKMEECEKLK